MNTYKLLATFMACFLAQLIAQSSFAQETTVSGSAKIKLTETEHSFGDITQGAVVKHVFELENTGSLPLLLTKVATTCGCTAPTWPRTPVQPGEKAQIEVQFDSRGKEGIQNKVVTIYSNAETPQVRIRISANVLP
jgi:Protein of unknown function (DUF1573)